MHGLPSDEINREQIDFTKEQQPTQARDKVNKRKKEEVTTNTSEQAICELDDQVRKEYEQIKKQRGTLADERKGKRLRGSRLTMLLKQCSNE